MFYISLDITYEKHQELRYSKTTDGRHSFKSQIILHDAIILQNITCITQHSHSCKKALTALVRLTSSALFLFILLLYYND